MLSFEEMMEQYRNPGENGIPETFADDLAAAHQEELSVRDAAVAARETAAQELQNQLEAAKAEQLRLKAVNYDLLMAAPKPGETQDENTNPDDGGEQRGVDSLFE